MQKLCFMRFSWSKQYRNIVFKWLVRRWTRLLGLNYLYISTLTRSTLILIIISDLKQIDKTIKTRTKSTWAKQISSTARTTKWDAVWESSLLIWYMSEKCSPFVIADTCQLMAVRLFHTLALCWYARRDSPICPFALSYWSHDIYFLVKQVVFNDIGNIVYICDCHNVLKAALVNASSC